MNWLNLKDLKTRLSKGEISEKDGFHYLLANFLVFGTSAFLTLYESYDDPGVLVVFILLPVIGLVLSFNANQKGDGKDFLKRFISLHFVVGIRFYLIAILFVAIMALVLPYISSAVAKGFILGGGIVAIGVGFYSTLSRSIKQVSLTK